jgi:hypothetical protein
MAGSSACLLAKLAQGTRCKTLSRQDFKSHKVRYYLERRDPEFDAQMVGSLRLLRGCPAKSVCRSWWQFADVCLWRQ